MPRVRLWNRPNKREKMPVNQPEKRKNAFISKEKVV